MARYGERTFWPDYPAATRTLRAGQETSAPASDAFRQPEHAEALAQLSARLAAAEAKLAAANLENQQAARDYVGELAGELSDPLEVVNNLAYLIRISCDTPELLDRFLALLDGQIALLNEIATRAYLFASQDQELK